MNIRACIFDLGGTIVDRYSRTPFLSLKNAFQKRNIRIDDRLIFKDMGMHKLNHIHEILKDPIVCLDWMNEYGVLPNNGEEEEIYNDFNEIQKKIQKNTWISCLRPKELFNIYRNIILKRVSLLDLIKRL